MVINLVKCTRCHACVAACRIEHFLPLGITWLKLIAWETEIPGQELTTYPVRCNQCKEAPCVEVCPAEATSKRPDGIVYVDNNKCVGCRYCVIACPYQNRTFFSKDKDPGYFPGFPRTRFELAGRQLYPHTAGTTEKCNFCMERIDAGLKKGMKPGRDRQATPACVNTCQARALTFGDLEDAESEVARLIKDKNGFTMHPEYGSEPAVYYIDGKIGKNTSNAAPRESQTAWHLQHLSTREQKATQIFGNKN
ncbi:MAG TPA: 4Fe-4S dicluster domain-containing protein [Dehalococcoidales bacterium]|nr:4Fe-4S dicluster domain-containing protein [Dehalococcoidales bacterium]